MRGGVRGGRLLHHFLTAVETVADAQGQEIALDERVDGRYPDRGAVPGRIDRLPLEALQQAVTTRQEETARHDYQEHDDRAENPRIPRGGASEHGDSRDDQRYRH